MLQTISKMKLGSKIALSNAIINLLALSCLIFFLNDALDKKLASLSKHNVERELSDQQQQLQQFSGIVYQLFEQQSLKHTADLLTQPQLLLNDFQKEIDNLILPEQGFVTISTPQGQLLYHSLYTLQQKPAWYQAQGLIDVLDANDYAIFRQIYQRASIAQKEGLLYYMVYPHQEEAGPQAIFVHAKMLTSANWIVACHLSGRNLSHLKEFEKKELQALTSYFLWFSSFIAIGCFITIIIVNRLLITYKLQQLTQIETAMHQLQTGDIQPPAVSPVDSNDEIACIGSYFNAISQNMRHLVVHLQTIHKELTQTQIEAHSTHAQLTCFCNEQYVGIHEIAKTIETTVLQMQQVVSKIREVSNIAQQVQQIVQQGHQTNQMTLQKIDTLKKSGTENVCNIRTLTEKMHYISDIIKTINGIAGQTRLIAFNAELEATAAGDAGRNFKIVATEIRKLSDHILEATSGIKHNVLETQTMIDHIVVASEETAEKISDTWQESHSLNHVFATIVTDSEVSATTSEEISKAIQTQSTAIEMTLQQLQHLVQQIEQSLPSIESVGKLAVTLHSATESMQVEQKKYRLI